MRHFTSPRFWALYNALPPDVRELADKNYQLLKADPRHPSLHFKRIGRLWSARIGDHFRVLGHDVPEGVHWFWIGTHADYDKIVARLNRKVFEAPAHPSIRLRAEALSALSLNDREADLRAIGLSGEPAAVPLLLGLLAKEKDEGNRV